MGILKNLKTLLFMLAIIGLLASPAMAGSSASVNVDEDVNATATTNQGQSQGHNAAFNGDINSGNTYGGEKNFVNQGGAAYPGHPAYLATPQNGYAEMRPADVLRFAKNFDISEYTDKFGVKIIIDYMNPKPDEDEVLPTKVKFIGTGDPKDDPEFPAERQEMAIITVVAKDKDVTMAKVIKATALACSSVDADTAFIEGFGSDRKVGAWGFGIGLAYTAANVSRDGNAGQVATGGTGWSTGEAGYHGYPWIQVHALRTIPSEIAPD